MFDIQYVSGGKRGTWVNLLSAQEGEVNRELGLGSSPSPSRRVRMWAASHYSSVLFCQASTNVLKYVT